MSGRAVAKDCTKPLSEDDRFEIIMASFWDAVGIHTSSASHQLPLHDSRLGRPN